MVKDFKIDIGDTITINGTTVTRVNRVRYQVEGETMKMSKKDVLELLSKTLSIAKKNANVNKINNITREIGVAKIKKLSDGIYKRGNQIIVNTDILPITDESKFKLTKIAHETINDYKISLDDNDNIIYPKFSVTALSFSNSTNCDILLAIINGSDIVGVNVELPYFVSTYVDKKLDYVFSDYNIPESYQLKIKQEVVNIFNKSNFIGNIRGFARYIKHITSKYDCLYSVIYDDEVANNYIKNKPIKDVNEEYDVDNNIIDMNVDDNEILQILQKDKTEPKQEIEVVKGMPKQIVEPIKTLPKEEFKQNTPDIFVDTVKDKELRNFYLDFIANNDNNIDNINAKLDTVVYGKIPKQTSKKEERQIKKQEKKTLPPITPDDNFQFTPQGIVGIQKTGDQLLAEEEKRKKDYGSGLNVDEFMDLGLL